MVVGVTVIVGVPMGMAVSMAVMMAMTGHFRQRYRFPVVLAQSHEITADGAAEFTEFAVHRHIAGDRLGFPFPH